MEDFKFIRYEPTPGEKHLGIATVLYHGKVILRYKILPTKDGGIWPTAPALKMGERWLDGHALDSQLDKDEVEALMRHHVANYSKSAHSGGTPELEPIPQDDDLPF